MITYDADFGEVTTTGNASLDGGARDMHIKASHATYNVRGHTGKFYDVTGSTGAARKALRTRGFANWRVTIDYVPRVSRQMLGKAAPARRLGDDWPGPITTHRS